MTIQKTLLLSLSLYISLPASPQKRGIIQKSWIKTSVENLSDKPIDPDTLYTRYTFDPSALYISFSPGWDTYKQDWSIKADQLTMGFDTYMIEALTDTSLQFALNGFRRVKFLSEEYVSSLDKNLVRLDDYNGKPLYKATAYITPRYAKKTSLRDVIGKNLEGYNIKKASYFLATFIVTESGKVENVQIVKGITDGFDNEVKRQLLKTSGNWIPAHFKKSPVQSLMFYDIKYLNSLTPNQFGELNPG